MEQYKKYLTLFNEFISASISYNHLVTIDNISGTLSNKEDALIKLKNSAHKLYAEFKKLPEQLQPTHLSNLHQ